jgi:hypothetical protein
MRRGAANMPALAQSPIPNKSRLLRVIFEEVSWIRPASSERMTRVPSPEEALFLLALFLLLAC